MAGAGYKLFNTGDVLTAAQVNTYLQEQAVMRFANAAARTTALSGVLAEGMVSYLQDTDKVEVYNGSAWVAVGGSSPLTTKGDLYTYSTADARLAVGSNNTILVADSAQSTGLKWGYLPFVGCLLTKTASTSFTANVETAGITYTTESFDTNNFHDNVTNTSRITIPSGLGGKYLVFTRFSTDDGISNYMYSNVQVSGGTTTRMVEVKNLAANNSVIRGNFIFNLSAGDYLEHKLQIGDTKTTNTQTEFGVAFLGA